MRKTVLITGASAGIGKATANYFQQAGWQVAATMRSPQKEVELNRLDNVRLFQLDVTSPESIDTAINDIIEQFGDIDVIVNNAGFGVFGPFEMASQVQIRRQYETNVFGLMNVCRAILPHFRQKKEGTIINISSGVGRFALPLQSLYNSTKFAVEGFSESLRYELEPFNISVKVVEPGAIKTNFFNVVDVADNPEENPYVDYQNQTMRQIMELDKLGSEPIVVAKEIFAAATDNKKKLRYPAGKDAKQLTKVVRFLPERMFFGLVKKLLKSR